MSQGVLFLPFASAEEQSKRSVYLGESNKKLYSYMKKRASLMLKVPYSYNRCESQV